MRIGITIGIQTAGEGIWVNGIKQNAVFLAKALQGVPGVEHVVLLNTTPADRIEQLAWDRQRFPTTQFEGYTQPLDLLIALGGALSQQQVDAWKQRGTRLVAYKCGSEYVQSMEAAMFGRELGGEPLYPTGYDAVWMIPQIAASCRHFYETLHRAPARAVPFVWDPMFLEEAAADLPGGALWTGRTRPARVSIFEPNIDVLKYCLYPLLICENLYRIDPGAFEFVSVLNTAHLRGNAEFLGLMDHLDLVRNNVAYFENRHPTPWFLANHSDAVVSHQWDNPLNYLYLETCWLGYPLVHNAPMCRELGFYYEGFDAQAGCDQLARALQPRDPVAWRDGQRQLITPWLADSGGVRTAYAQLILETMA